MAFIVDIRRQAVMQHLMFKAVFELAKDRADFISLLFCEAPARGPRRERRPSSRSGTPMRRWRPIPTLAAKNYARIVDHLTRTQVHVHAEETAQLQSVFEAFFAYRTRDFDARRVGGGGNS